MTQTVQGAAAWTYGPSYAPSTSPLVIDVTNIPVGVCELEIFLHDIALSAGDNFRLQIGNSSTLLISGYYQTVNYNQTGIAPTLGLSTTAQGWDIVAQPAGYGHDVVWSLNRISLDTHIWVCRGISCGLAGATYHSSQLGSIDVAADLWRFRIGSASGTSTFVTTGTLGYRYR